MTFELRPEGRGGKSRGKSGYANGGSSECQDPERRASLACSGVGRSSGRLAVVMGRAACRGVTSEGT